MNSSVALFNLKAKRKQRFNILALGLVLVVSVVWGISQGALSVNLFGQLNELERAVILNVRLPRVLMTAVTGAGLAMCGLVMQALTRNPLADPSIIGVSIFAALFAAIAMLVSAYMILPEALAVFFIPIMAFAGAGLALVLLLAITGHKNTHNTLIMLLTGVALNAAASTLIGLIFYVADDETLRAITFWQLGSYGGSNFMQVCIASVAVVSAFVFFMRNAKRLMVLQIGESHARFQGVKVDALKYRSLLLVALVTAVCVCFTGIVGFIGLVVPHITRMLIGSNMKIHLPCSVLMGASIVTLADMAARLLVVPAELPIGLLTTALGVPFFLALILREKSRYVHD